MPRPVQAPARPQNIVVPTATVNADELMSPGSGGLMGMLRFSQRSAAHVAEPIKRRVAVEEHISKPGPSSEAKIP